jgi:hypothetical protein
MAVNPSPLGPKPQFMLASGLPANGYKLFFYAAGSSTKQNTYTDSTGNTANSNPIVLNSLGQPATEIWFAAGESYKVVLAPSNDTDPPASPVWSIDNLEGINDATVTIDQWVTSGVTPTYVSGTQFTVPGDQTSAFHVGRRVKCTVTAGTVYGYISVTAYTSLTTVTVVLDSGSLDSGLSAVQLGLLTRVNPSQPNLTDAIFRIYGSADLTKKVAFEVDGLTTATTRTWTVQDKDITVAGLADVNGGTSLGSKIQDVDASVAANALTITINPTALDFRSTTLTDGTPVTRTLSAAVSVVVPNTATLGTTNAQQARLAILAIDNAGTIEAAVINISGGNNLDETTLISTTAMSTGADSANVIYSTSARASVAFRVVGFIDITEASAGVWATAPTLVQGAGGNAMTAMGSLGFGQTYQDVTGSRTLSTIYYNTTGKPITVVVRTTNTTATSTLSATIGGVSINLASGSAGTGAKNATFIVPPGMSYLVSENNVPTLVSWYELR